MVWWLGLPIVGLQSFTGYLGLTLDFLWNGALLENFSFYFSGCFAGIGGMFILAGDCGLGYHSMKFRHFPEVS